MKLQSMFLFCNDDSTISLPFVYLRGPEITASGANDLCNKHNIGNVYLFFKLFIIAT